MDSDAAPCSNCAVRYTQQTTIPCTLCGQVVHDGPAVYCGAVSYELEEGTAVIGDISTAPRYSQRRITFPAWHIDVIDALNDANDGLVVCEDCLHYDL